MAKCCYCENELRPYSQDPRWLQTKEHLVPVSKGGLDVVQNIQPCCRRCNLWRLNYELEDWLYKVETEKRAIAPRYSLEVLDKITLNICKWVGYVDKHKSKLRDPAFQRKHKNMGEYPKGLKLCLVDLETTGVKHWRNGIHQISGCIDINGRVAEWFDFKVQPNQDPGCVIEDEALAVSGVTREQVQAYPPMDVIYRKLIAMLSKYVDQYNPKDKFFMVGYNNRGFDDNFLRAWFKQNKDEYYGSWFWADSIDVMVLASNAFKLERAAMKDFKLMTVALHAGLVVDETKLHDALYDIKLTRDLYYALNM